MLEISTPPMIYQPMNLQDATIVEGSYFEHFLLLQDPEGQQKIPLAQKTYILGRSLDSDIVLRSQSVSREHGTLTSIKLPAPLLQVFRLSDGTSDKGKSTNGILINGEIRDSWVLMHGDEIVFSSNTKATYIIDPEPPYTNGKIGSFLECLYELGQNASKLGQYTEAAQYLEQILVLNQNLYGDSHPHVAKCLIDLAANYYSQNQLDKAEALFLKAISIRQSTLGKNHPDVAMAMLDLAAIYSTQAMYDQAETMFLKALEIKQTILGADHAEIAANLVDLASIYYSQKRFLEVKQLYEKALKIYQRSLGENHQTSLAVQKKLVNLKKKLRPKWLSWNIIIPSSLILLSGVIAYTFFAPKTDIACIKILPDGRAKSISGDECRQITK